MAERGGRAGGEKGFSARINVLAIPVIQTSNSENFPLISYCFSYNINTSISLWEKCVEKGEQRENDEVWMGLRNTKEKPCAVTSLLFSQGRHPSPANQISEGRRSFPQTSGTW